VQSIDFKTKNQIKHTKG